MQEYAHLLVHSEFNAFTESSHIVAAEWVGHHSQILRVDSRCCDEKVLALLPFDLEPIEEEDPIDRFLGFRCYARKDRHFWLAYHRFMQDWQKVLNVKRWIEQRMIMTLVVWGIGWVEQGQMVGWYCLGQKPPWRVQNGR